MNIIPINNYLRDNDERSIERCGFYYYDSSKVDPSKVDNKNIKVVEGVNIHPEPQNNFILDPKTTLALHQVKESGKEVGVWHSHIGKGLTGFSPKDMQEIYSSDIPWYMVHMDLGATDYCDPRATVPLEGREWRWASQNCYTLIKDFYKQEFGITLDHFFNAHPTCWEDDGWRAYLDNIENQGFKRVEDAKYGDVILMKIGRAYSANHGAIRLQPSSNEMLHHMAEKVSRVELLDNNGSRRIDSGWRYNG